MSLHCLSRYVCLCTSYDKASWPGHHDRSKNYEHRLLFFLLETGIQNLRKNTSRQTGLFDHGMKISHNIPVNNMNTRNLAKPAGPFIYKQDLKNIKLNRKYLKDHINTSHTVKKQLLTLTFPNKMKIIRCF